MLVLPTAGVSAQQTFMTTGSVAGGSVRVRGEWCSPWLRVLIDGVDVMPSQAIGATWATLTFGPAGGAGDHTLRFVHRDGSCALRFDHVTLTVNDPPPPPPPPPSPIIVEAESATGQGTVVTDAAASGGAYRAFAAAYQKASASFGSTVAANGTVRVRSAGCSAPPTAKVTVGSTVTMQQVPASGVWTTIALGAYGVGTYPITFEHRYGLAGCALHFDQATFMP